MITKKPKDKKIKVKIKKLKPKRKGKKMNVVNASELTVNGVTYVPKGSEKIQYTGDIKIVILQRGWILVGKFEKNGSECKLHNASVIRNWGTTKGLGEIAQAGPTANTKIDATNGLVEFDYLTVVATIACNAVAWSKYV